MMQAGLSGGVNLPSLEYESVTLQSHDGKGLGFDVSANADGGFTVQDVQGDGAAGASGKIKAGDRITGIAIDMDKLGKDDTRKLLNALAPFPVKFNIKKQGAAGAGLGAGLKIDAPKLDFGVNGAKADVTLPGNGADVGFTAEAPKFGAGATVGLPSFGAEVDGSSKGGIDVNLPDVEIDPGSIELPGGKGGSFGRKMKGFFSPGNGKKDKQAKGKAKFDADVSLPSVELEPGKVGGNIEGGFQPGDIDVTVGKPNVSVDIGGPNIEGDLKAKLPKAERESWFEKHRPKIGLGKSGKYSVADASASIDVEAPSVEVKAPKPDLKGKIELKGNLPKSEFHVPEISGEGEISGSPGAGIKFQAPTVDFDVKKPSIDTNVDVNLSLPKAAVTIPEKSGSIAITSPSVDVSLPEVDVDTSGPSIGGKIKGFFKRGDSKKKNKGKPDDTGGIKLGFEAEGPKLDYDIGTNVNLPKGSIEVNPVDVDIKGPRISGAVGGDAGVGFDLKGKGPAAGISFGAEGQANPELPELDVDIGRGQLHDADISAPKGKAGGGIHFGIPKFEMKGKGPKGEFDAGGDASLPSGDIEGKVEGELPDVDVDVKKPKGSGGIHFGLPSFGIKGKGPQGELDVGGDVSLQSGGIEGNIEGELPDVDVNVKKPKGSSGIHFGLPSFGIKGKGPKGELDVGGDVSLPSGGIEGSIEGELPDVDVDVDVKKPKGSGGIHFGLPSFGIKGKGPKAELDVGGDVSLPSGGIEGKVKGELPDVDVDVKKPKGSGGIHFGLPSFGIKGKGPKGELDVGGDVSLPSGGIGGNVEGELPDVDVDVKKPKGSGGIHFGLPSFGIKGKGPKGELDVGGDVSLPSGGIEGNIEGELPDVDVDVKKPKGSGGIHFGLPSFGIKGKGPKGELDAGGDVSLPSGGIEGKVEGELPDVDVDVKKPKGSGGIHFGLPSFGIKGKGPNGELDVGGDVSLPSGGIEGNIEGELPDVDVDVKKPKGSGGIHFGLPSFGIKGKGPKGELDVGGDVSLPSGGIEGNIEGELPDVDVDVKKPKGSGGIHFGLPSFGIKGKGPKGELDVGGDVSLPSGGIEGKVEGELPDVDVDVKKPKGSGGIHFGLPSFGIKGKGPKGELDVGGDVSLPSGCIEGKVEGELPDVDVDVKKPKGSGGIHFGLPSFGIKGKGPKGELDVGGDVSLPSGGIEGNIEGELPDVDVDVKKPKGSGGIHFGLPSFGIKGKGPKGELDVGGDVSLPSGGIEGNIEGELPDVDVDVKKPKGSGGIHFGLPSFGIKGKGPKGELDAGGDVSLPSGSIDGNIEGELPDVDVDVKKPKGSGGIHFGLPSFGIKGKGPKGELDVGGDVSLPSGGIEGNIEGELPDVDVDVKKPKGSGGIHFGLPSFGIKGKGPKGELDAGGDVSLPSGGIEGKFEGEVPDVDVSVDKPKGSGGFHIGFPKFGFKGKGKGPKAELDVEGDASLPSGGIEGKVEAVTPEVDIKLKKPKGSGGFHIGFPKFKGKGSKPELDVQGDVSVPTGGFEGKVEGELPDVDVDVKKPKGSGGIHFGLPSFGIKGKGPKGELDAGGDVSLPSGGIEGNIEGELPDVDVDAKKPKGSGGIHFGLPSFGIKGKGPKGELDVGGDVSLPSGGIEGNIEGELPDVDVDVKKPKGSSGIHFGLPSFGIKGKGPKGELDVGDVSLPSGNIEGKVEGELPDVDVDVKKPKGSGGIHFGLPSFGIKGKGPKGELDVGGDVSLPSGGIEGNIEGELPDVDVDVTKPKGSGGIHFGLPSFGIKGKGQKGELDAGGDVSLPSGGIEGNIEGELPDVDVDVKKAKGSGGIHFGLPSFGIKGKGPKGELDVGGDVSLPSEGIEGKVEGELPDVDVDMKKPKGSGGIHFGLPSFGIKGKGPKGELDVGGDVSLPSGGIGGNVEGELPDVDVDVKKPKGSGGIHFGLPSFGIKGKGPKGELDVGGDVSLPSGGIEGKVESELPDVDVDVKKPKGSGGIHFGLPSFGIKGKGPKGELDVGGDVSLPSGGIEGNIEGELPDVDVDVKKPKGSGGIHFGLPSFGIKGKGQKGELDAGGDVSLPSGGIEGNIEGELPNVDVDVKKPKGSGGIHFGLPSFGIKGKGPKGELDVGGDVSLPSGGIEGKVEGELPDVDVDVKKPKGSGGIHFGLPSFGIKGKGPKGELDVGGDVSLPSGGIEGNIEGELPDVDVDVKKPKGSGGIHFGLPSFGIKGKGQKGELDAGGDVSLPSGGIEGNIEGELPDVDVDVKKPKGSGGIHFGLPSFGIKGKGPKGELDVGGDVSLPSGGIEGKVEGELPDVDVDVKKPKGSGGIHFGLPSFGIKGKGPKGELDVGGDVSLPSRGIGGNVEGELPDVDINVDKPKGGGGISIGLPSIGMKGKGKKGNADVSADVSLPSGGIEGKVEGQLPGVDISADKPKGKGGFHIGFPKFGSKGKAPKGDFDANVDASLPSPGIKGKIEGDLPDVDVNIDLHKPVIEGGADINSPEGGIDLNRGALHDVGKGKGSGGFHFGLPKFGSKGKGSKGDAGLSADVKLPSGGVEGKVECELPDADISVKKPKGSGGFSFGRPKFGRGKSAKGDIDVAADASLPSGGIEGKVGVDIPDVEIKGDKPKGSAGINVDLPSIGIKGKAPKVDIDTGADISLPSGSIDVDGGLPDAEINIKKPKGSGGFSFGLPKFGIKGKSGKGDIDVEGDASLPSGKIEGQIEGSVDKPKSSGGIHISAPSFDASLPSGKIEGKVEGGLPDVDVSVDKPKASGGIHFGMPSLGFKGKGPKGDIDIGGDASLPSGKIEGKVEGDLPDVDISVDKPKGSGGFHMPSLGFKGKGPKGDINIGGDASLPSGKIEGKVEGDLPDVDISVDKPKGSGGFHMPTFGFKGKGPTGDINIEGDASLPSGKIEGKVEGDLPDVDISVDKPKGSGGFHMPSLGFKGKGPKGDIDIGADASLPSGKIEGKVEGDLPDVDISVDKPKGSGGFHMPTFGFKGKGPKGDINIGGDASLPSGKIEGKVEGDLPDVDISVDKPKGSGGFHMPSLGFKGKGPKGDINIGGDVSLPSGKIEGKVEGDLPDVDISVDKPKGSGGFHMPTFGFKGKGPKGDINIGGDASLPSGKIEGKVEGDLPDVDISVDKPKGSGGFHMPSLGFKGKGPKGDINIGGDASLPSGKIEGKVEGDFPDVDISVDKPKGSGGFHMPTFGFKGKGPKGDINIGGDASLPSGKIEGKVEGDLPDVDISVDKPKGSGGFHMPSLGFKGKGPKGDIDIGADASLPSGKIQGKVEGYLPDVDISVDKPKGSGGIHFGMPSLGFKGKGPKGDIDIGADASLPSGKIEGKVEGDLPDVDISVDKPKGSGGLPKFGFGHKGKGTKGDIDLGADASLPSGKLEGKIEGELPDVDLNIEKPKGSGGIQIGMPSINIKGKSPKGEIDIGEVSLPSGSVERNVAGELPEAEFGIKKPKGSGGFSIGLPKFGITGKGPKGDIDAGAEVSIPSAGIDGKVDADLPDVDVHLDKPKASGGIHIGKPSFGFKGKGPKIETDVGASASLPSGGVEGNIESAVPEVDIETKKPKGSSSGGIHFGLPRLSFKGKSPKAEVHAGEKSLSGGVEGSLKGSGSPDADFNVGIQGPSVDIDTPELKAGKKGFGNKMKGFFSGSGKKNGKGKTKGGISVELPDVDLNVAGPQVSVEGTGDLGKVKGPDVNIEAELPKLDLRGKGPEVDIHHEGKIDLPEIGGDRGALHDADIPKSKVGGGIHFGLPKFKGKGPKADFDANADASLPSGNLEGKVQADLPDVDANVNMPKGGIQIGMPSLGFKGKGPKGDIDIGADAHFPSGKIEGKVEGDLPDVDISVDKPKGSGGFHMPSLGFKGKGPKGDINIGGDASLPSGKIEGKVEGDLPDVDISVDKPKGSGGFHMPTFGFKGKGPKGDIDIGGDASLPSGKIEGKVEGDLPDVDISVDKPKGSGGFHMPTFGFKGKGPKGDINIGGDASLPSGKIEGKVEGDLPDVDISVDKPKASGGFHMPSLGFKGKGPKGDINIGGDASLPSGKIEGKVEGDLPDVDISVDKPKGSGGFHMPSLGFKGKGPKGDIDIGADASLPSGKIEGKVEGDLPDVDISVDKPKGSGGIHFGMPSLGFKGKSPKGDIDIGADASLPSGKIEGKVEGDLPDVDISVDKPKGSGGIHFGMPSLGFKGKSPKGEVDIGADASLPSGKVKGKVEGDLPDVDVNVDKPKGSGGFHIDMPKFEFGHKGKSPTGDINLGADASLPSGKLEGKIEGELPDVSIDKPKGSGAIHVGLPSLFLEGKGPKGNVDIGASVPSGAVEGKLNSPDIDASVDKPKASGGFHFGLPKIGVKSKGSKGDTNLSGEATLPSGGLEGKVEGELPDVDVSVKKPKGGGGFHIGKPKFGIKGKAPEASADLKVDAPTVDVNIPSSDIGFDASVQGPKIEKEGQVKVKIPKFGAEAGSEHPGVDASISFEGPDVDLESPTIKASKKGDFGGKMKRLFSGSGKKKGKGELKGDMSIDLPSADVNVSGPDVSFEGKGEAPGIHVDAETPKGSSGLKINLPKFGAQVKAPEVEAGVDTSLKAPKGSIEGGVHADAADVSLGTSKGSGSGAFHIGLPKFGGKGGKAEVDALLGSVEGSVKADVPQAKLEGDKSKSGGNFQLGLPKFGINWQGSKEAGEVGTTGGGIEGKLSADVGSTNLEAGRLTGSAEVPSFGIEGSVPQAGIDVKSPKLESNIGLSVDAPKSKVSGELPGAEIQFGKPKGSGGVCLQGPSGGVSLQGPSGGVSLQGPSADVSFDAPKTTVSGSLDLESPSVQIEHPDLKSDKRASLGRKVKGFFSSKDRSSSPKADVDVSLGGAEGSSVDKPGFGASGGVKVTPPAVQVDLKKAKDAEFGFATSYDAGLHHEAAVDVQSPSVSVGGEAECGSPSSDNERSMLHDEKSHKFHLKLGGKSSKSKADKKKRPRIEEGLRSGLATELLVSGGYVQLSDEEKNRQKDESRTDNKKKSSQSEA